MPYTRVGYESLELFLEKERAKGAKQMEPQRDVDERIRMWSQGAPGGFIRLSVGRGTIGAANMEWFTIIVQTPDGKEVFRHAFESDVPEVPIDGGDWWNSGSAYIPVPVSLPFNVFVVDRLSDAEPMKFEITKAHQQNSASGCASMILLAAATIGSFGAVIFR